jgi:hypothetical protein
MANCSQTTPARDCCSRIPTPTAKSSGTPLIDGGLSHTQVRGKAGVCKPRQPISKWLARIDSEIVACPKRLPMPVLKPEKHHQRTNDHEQANTNRNPGRPELRRSSHGSDQRQKDEHYSKRRDVPYQ